MLLVLGDTQYRYEWLDIVKPWPQTPKPQTQNQGALGWHLIVPGHPPIEKFSKTTQAKEQDRTSVKFRGVVSLEVMSLLVC